MTTVTTVTGSGGTAAVRARASATTLAILRHQPLELHQRAFFIFPSLCAHNAMGGGGE